MRLSSLFIRVHQSIVTLSISKHHFIFMMRCVTMWWDKLAHEVPYKSSHEYSTIIVCLVYKRFIKHFHKKWFSGQNTTFRTFTHFYSSVLVILRDVLEINFMELVFWVKIKKQRFFSIESQNIILIFLNHSVTLNLNLNQFFDFSTFSFAGSRLYVIGFFRGESMAHCNKTKWTAYNLMIDLFVTD